MIECTLDKAVIVWCRYSYFVCVCQSGIMRSSLMEAHPDHNPEVLEHHQGLHPLMTMTRKHCLCQVCELSGKETYL